MFRKFRWRNFRPFKQYATNSYCSCGGTVLAMLTGTHPSLIHVLHPKNNDWTINWMLAFLDILGYAYHDISRASFTKKRKQFERVFDDNHVFIGIIRVNKQEDSWVLIHNNRVYHCGTELDQFRGLDAILNFPIRKLWVVRPNC